MTEQAMGADDAFGQKYVCRSCSELTSNDSEVCDDCAAEDNSAAAARAGVETASTLSADADDACHLKAGDYAQSLCGKPYAFPHRFSDRLGDATCIACIAVAHAEAAQLNLYRQAERDRQFCKAAEEAFDLISPFVAKFAEAASHYDGGTPRYPGSIFLHDPEPSYRPCLTSTALPPCGAPETPTIGDLRLLADAYAQAIEARRAETGTGSVHESAVGETDAPKDIPHDQ